MIQTSASYAEQKMNEISITEEELKELFNEIDDGEYKFVEWTGKEAVYTGPEGKHLIRTVKRNDFGFYVLQVIQKQRSPKAICEVVQYPVSRVNDQWHIFPRETLVIFENEKILNVTSKSAEIMKHYRDNNFETLDRILSENEESIRYCWRYK